jgi:hypothetical protein
MTEMVETAVRLARAAENLPERLRKRELAAGGVARDQDAEEEILELDEVLADTPVQIAVPLISNPAAAPFSAAPAVSLPKVAAAAASVVSSGVIPTSVSGTETAPAAAAKKPLFWSAALTASPEAEKSSEADQSHVPAVLRKLHKCHACGFPVSATRLLCVECEEKKWRGQLRRPAPVAMKADRTAQPGTVAAVAAPSLSAAVVNIPARTAPSAAVAAPAAVNPKPAELAEQASSDLATGSVPSFVLSAGLDPSQSWISANKYVVAVMVVAAAAVAAFFLLR